MNYFLVLLAYIPGILALLLWKKTWNFPILTMTFLGMFFFNAVGSISVLNLSSVYWVHFDRIIIRSEYCFLLVTEVLIYYVIAGAYIAHRVVPNISLTLSRFDDHFMLVGIFIILTISIAYFSQTGVFLLYQSMIGTLTIENANEYRMRYVYGLKNWPIYNLGFVMLPTFLTSYSLIRANVIKKLDFLFYFSFFVCFSASLSLGSKAGVFGFVLSLGVAYIVYFSTIGQPPWRIFSNKRFMLFSILSLLLLVYGYFRATPGRMTLGEFLERFWYRLFVTPTETIAATISYTKELKFLGISVFPTARGLLSHHQENLPLMLHNYISLSPGGMNVPMVAEVFLVNGWTSIFLMLPAIFLVLVVLQELIFKIKVGIFSAAISAFYGYLGLLLSVIGMFGTLFTFMYIGVLVFITALVIIGTKFFKSGATQSGL